MIPVTDNLSLLRLFYDVHNILCEGSKEFAHADISFDFDSKKRAVKCVRFLFYSRRKYYEGVYPRSIELFNYLDRMGKLPYSGFSFIRHSVNVFYKDGEKKYSVVLCY